MFRDAENNIHAGAKMMAQITKTYFNDPGISQMNKTLFTFAAYNAGQNRIVRLRKEAQTEGLDPAKWFGNVELVVAKDIGQETVQYVSTISNEVGSVKSVFISFAHTPAAAQSRLFLGE